MVGPGVGALLLACCFLGDAADGLPCEKDADCGIGVVCQEDPATSTLCCGGTCLAGGASGSTTTEGSTGDPSSSSSSMSSTLSAGEASSTTGEPCGNVVVDPEEECDPGLPEPCSADCRRCGNGVLDGDELCDPGISGQEDACEECMQLTLLSWDSRSPTSQAEADFVFPSWEGPVLPLQWRRDRDSGALVSGPYMGPELAPAAGLDVYEWPQSRLLSRPLDFPELRENDRVVVRINHAYALGSDGTLYFDHGRVDFVPDPDFGIGSWLPLLPRGDGAVVDCRSPAATCFAVSPSQSFCDGSVTSWLAGSGSDSGVPPIELNPETVSGQTLQLSFRLRYDCLNPMNPNRGTVPTNDAWTVSEVSVVVTRPAP